MAEKSIIIYKFKPTPKPKGWKSWMGKYAVKGTTVFVPAQLSGRSTMEIWLCAGYEANVPICMDGPDMLVPATWLMREFPETSQYVEIIVRKAIEARWPNR